MKTILKSIIGGAFLGALIFFAGPLILIVLLLKFIFTPFGMGRMAYAHHWGYGPRFMRIPVMADKIRTMSEEEYQEFKNKMSQRHYGHCCEKPNTNN